MTIGAGSLQRSDGRLPGDLRPLTLTLGVQKWAEGSCLIKVGGTEVLCAATIEDKVPPHLRGKGTGWVTAEYSMLPRATSERNIREAAKGKVGGRTYEIQRLVGRSLRGVVDMAKLGERSITIDCDVLNADGGTRTASITGGWVGSRRAWASPNRRSRPRSRPQARLSARRRSPAASTSSAPSVTSAIAPPTSTRSAARHPVTKPWTP